MRADRLPPALAAGGIGTDSGLQIRALLLPVGMQAFIQFCFTRIGGRHFVQPIPRFQQFAQLILWQGISQIKFNCLAVVHLGFVVAAQSVVKQNAQNIPQLIMDLFQSPCYRLFQLPLHLHLFHPARQHAHTTPVLTHPVEMLAPAPVAPEQADLSDASPRPRWPMLGGIRITCIFQPPLQPALDIRIVGKFAPFTCPHQAP